MRQADFKWGALSSRQKKVMSWWAEGSPFKDYNGIIADGAIRSGKTVSMAFAFVMWAMTKFKTQNFAICGKTVGSVHRNVVIQLKRQLMARGYYVKERHSEGCIVVSAGSTTNIFYLFGGRDESSQDIVQGITLAGAFFDEVALMPMSFVNQTTARCSVDGSKWWFNCNPASPQHWFYTDWIQRSSEKKLMYLHFTMDDNLTLTKAIKERYEMQYTGVFYARYIKGLWVMAEGLVYDMFSREAHVLKDDVECEGEYYVSSDYGIQNATVFLLWRKEKGSERWICLREYYYSGRDNSLQKTVSQLRDGMESILPVDSENRIIEPEVIIVDPSASALIVELRKHGHSCREANNDVLGGIEDVSTMLHRGNIAFSPRCKNTIAEFGLYSWDSKAAERGEDKPLKVSDHAMDAVRYFVKTLGLVRRLDEEQYNSFF